MLKKLLAFILFFITISIVYSIWAIQPLPFDDWCITKLHTLFSRPPLPQTGQQIRYCFNGMYFFTTNPFSFFKAWSLFTAVFLTSLLWAAFIKESIFIRAGLALLALLGFPYLGHIGAWNHAAAIYTTSVVWMALWYVVFRKMRYPETHLLLKGALSFILTFIAASWHEVWLITFAGITGYMIFDAFFLLQKRNQSFKMGYLSIHLGVVLAYILAVAFYTRGGPSQFIDDRLGVSGTSASLFSLSHIIKTCLLGTKENLILIRDGFPVFLLIVYIKFNKNFQNKLSSDFILFLVAALGSILFIYVYTFIVGSVVWRVRWLCAVSLGVAFYALPKSILIDCFSLKRRDFIIKAIRFCSITVAVIWLSYNAYRTYVYTNIDVAGWLKYRQMVLDRNPDVMKKDLSFCLLPKNRPRGVATWDHAWGAQDDKYRFFMAPRNGDIHTAIKAIWDDESTKRFFIY